MVEVEDEGIGILRNEVRRRLGSYDVGQCAYEGAIPDQHEAVEAQGTVRRAGLAEEPTRGFEPRTPSLRALSGCRRLVGGVFVTLFRLTRRAFSITKS